MKLIIGLLIISTFAVNAVPAAALFFMPRPVFINRAATNAQKVCNKIGDTVWRNKEAIAICTVSAVALSAPEAVVAGTTSIVTSGTEAVVKSATNAAGGNFLSYLLFAILFIAILWLSVKYVRLRFSRVVPLLIIGLLFCFSGTAEAAILDFWNIPALQCAAIKPPFWDFFNFILIIFSLLM